MKKIALLLLAAAMIFSLAVSASAYFEAEEAFGEVKFEIGKQTAAWNPDGTITDGEYFKVDIKPEWLSYAINDNDTDAGLAYAKATTPELYMSWDETYVYTATRYEVTEGHENLWDGDPASMWYSGAVQFNYANFDEVASEYRLEYGVGLSSDTGDTLYTVWADGVGNGYEPTQDDAKVWLDGNTLTYETRVPWEAFADEDNTGYKEGNGFNTTFVWSIGKGQDYVHIQLAEGCTGNGKHAENMAQVTLAGAVASAAPADPNAPSILWDFNSDNAMDANMGANSGANGVTWAGEKDDAGNEYYVFTAGGNDPYVSVDLSAADVSDVVWAKARVKNAGPATAIELFGHTDGRGLTGSECTHIDVGTDGEWHTYIVYIPDANVATVNAYKDPQYAITEPYWAGTVDWIRLDPMWQEGDDGSDSGGSMSAGDEIMIDYIAFFSSEEAAKAFRADQDSEYVAIVYPASGAGDNIITGTVIGNETGWGDNAAAGAAAAFDGNPATFFDPLGVGDGFCGMDAGESYILDKVAILSRDGWADRFAGAMIQGSNDGENWTTLWTSPAAAASTTEYTIVTEFENNTGYSQYRYFNETNHGDVAEVEFYGNPGQVEAEEPAEEPTAESKGFSTAEDAAAGKAVITGYTFVEGSTGFGGEGAENLWDGDTATKFCTNEFPVVSVAELDGVYTINGFTMATANDNADYNGRSPDDWTIYVSADGENWTELAKGDDSFFEETNFTYYAGDASAEGVSYVKLEAASTPASLFQVSELNLLGEKTGEKGAVDEALDDKAEAPQTFDFGIIAAVAAVVSLAGFAVSKKKH